MQYRIWSEMIVGGISKGMEDIPTNPLFLRAGGTYPKKKNPTGNDALTQAVADIASALNPRAIPANAMGTNQLLNSPAKTIDSRSKCYRQLSELKNLVESGLLSNEEYRIERDAIMNTLKKLTC